MQWKVQSYQEKSFRLKLALHVSLEPIIITEMILLQLSGNISELPLNTTQYQIVASRSTQGALNTPKQSSILELQLDFYTTKRPNQKPTSRWNCLDCGFSLQVCCEFNNGSAECRKRNDCPAYTNMRN